MVSLSAFAIAAVLGVSASDEPSTKPNPFLEQAKQLYVEVQFEQCAQRLEQAARWDNSGMQLRDIEIYAGLCLFNLGRTLEARDRFQVALRLDPGAALPPYSAPKALAFFRAIAAKRPADSPRVRPAEAPQVEPLAPVERPAPAAQAMLLEPLPRRVPVATYVCSGLAGAFAVTAAVLMVQAKGWEKRANEEPFEQRAYALGDNARQAATFSYLGMAGTAAAASGALITYLLSVPGRAD